MLRSSNHRGAHGGIGNGNVFDEPWKESRSAYSTVVGLVTTDMKRKGRRDRNDNLIWRRRCP